MCVQCVSNTEMFLLSGAGVGAAVSHGARQAAFALGFVSPEARAERDARIYRENAGFIEGLGLDPETVLGPAPVPVPAPARARRPLRPALAPLRALRTATGRVAPVAAAVASSL